MRQVRMADNLHHPVPLSRNLGTLTSWNPLGHPRPVTGLLYLLITASVRTFFGLHTYVRKTLETRSEKYYVTEILLKSSVACVGKLQLCLWETGWKKNLRNWLTRTDQISLPVTMTEILVWIHILRTYKFALLKYLTVVKKRSGVGIFSDMISCIRVKFTSSSGKKETASYICRITSWKWREQIRVSRCHKPKQNSINAHRH
jgi:hypothetical protein